MTKIGQFGIEDTFKAKHSKRTVTFRAADGFGRDLDSVVIEESGESLRAIQVRPEDAVGMAVAVLGIGRIDANLEGRARIVADQEPPLMRRRTDDELIEDALVPLRALMIRRERAEAASAKLTDDAYALYKLARPEESVSVEVFSESMRDYWLRKLLNLRAL